MLYDPRAFVYTLRVCDSFGPEEGAQKLREDMSDDQLRRMKISLKYGCPRPGVRDVGLGNGRVLVLHVHSWRINWFEAMLRTLEARGVC